MMPNVIQSPNYHSALSLMAWWSAGWAACMTPDGFVEAWGPKSILPTIALDVLDLTGCLDAKL